MDINYNYIYLLIGWFSEIGFQVWLAQTNYVAGDDHTLSILLLLSTKTWDYSVCYIWFFSSRFLK